MRSEMLRRLGGCLLLAAVSAVAACSSAPAPASARASVASLVPGCSTQVTTGSRLSASRAAQVSVPGDPTGVASSLDGRWAFATLSQNGNGGEPRLAVLAIGRAGGGRRLALARLITLPASLAAAWGVSASPDGRLLLVAGGSGTAVLSVPRVESGAAHPVLGVLPDSGAGVFEAAVSADDRYAFVTAENTGDLYVFSLALALRRGFSAPGVAVGAVPLATGALGIAISPDGTLIYVTTFGQYGPHGRLWVINAARAERTASPRAVVARTAAGCQPVRVALSDDGRVAWVSALQSNAVLALSYDAADGSVLMSDFASAMVQMFGVPAAAGS